jgi:hypothetical protein
MVQRSCGSTRAIPLFISRGIYCLSVGAVQIDGAVACAVLAALAPAGKRDELAALVFVTLDDLFFLYLLAGAGIVRPQEAPVEGSLSVLADQSGRTRSCARPRR